MLGTGTALAVYKFTMRQALAIVLSLTGVSASPRPQLRAIKSSILGRERSLPHLERKLYHMLMGVVCFALYAFVLTKAQALFILFAVGGVWITLDALRLKYPHINSLALSFFGKLMRREELKSMSGNSFYILGLIVSVFFFPKPIVLLAVLYLALGDPTAAIVGSLYGKHKLVGKKSLEGALANLIVCGTASFVFGRAYLHSSLEASLALGIFGGLVSVTAELLPAPIDDNFTIPVFSAVLLSVLSLLGLPLF